MRYLSAMRSSKKQQLNQLYRLEPRKYKLVVSTGQKYKSDAAIPLLTVLAPTSYAGK